MTERGIIKLWFGGNQYPMLYEITEEAEKNYFYLSIKPINKEEKKNNG